MGELVIGQYDCKLELPNNFPNTKFQQQKMWNGLCDTWSVQKETELFLKHLLISLQLKKPCLLQRTPTVYTPLSGFFTVVERVLRESA
jgi:hypothetical protein